MKSEGDQRQSLEGPGEGDDEDGEDKWLCDGSNLFDTGCKSGMTDFDHHEGIEGWTSTNQDEDFDLCEMCVRWCMHCEKNNLDLQLKKDSPANDPEDDLKLLESL